MSLNVEDPEIAAPGLGEFAQEFLADRIKEIEVIKKSLNMFDLETVKKIAHQWKGFSRPYGFGTLEKISTRLELSALNGSIEECEAQVCAAREYLGQKANELRAKQE